MSNPIMSIDPNVLQTVTGGSHSPRSYGSSSDQLLKDLSSLASSIKDISAKTSGFDSTQTMLFLMLAMQRSNQGSNVVYVRRW